VLSLAWAAAIMTIRLASIAAAVLNERAAASRDFVRGFTIVTAVKKVIRSR
jgi:hypothetical protein